MLTVSIQNGNLVISNEKVLTQIISKRVANILRGNIGSKDESTKLLINK